jgi:hypothetical protein
MSRKGKSRTRNARADLMRSRAAMARKKARQAARAKGYDQHKYDGSDPDAGQET